MAKDLAALLVDTRQIIGQTSTSNTDLSDGQLTIWLNDAYRKVAMKLRDLPITKKDYTPATEDVTLDNDVVTIDLVKFNVQPENEFIELEIITLDELIKKDANWENAQADKPSFFIRNGTLTALLHPPLNTANKSQTLRTWGMFLPTNLSLTTDKPVGLPGNLHDILPNWAAHRALQILRRREDSVTQLILFNSGLKDQLNLSRETSRHEKRWRFESIDTVHDFGQDVHG